MLYDAILEVNNAQQPKVLSLFSFLFIVCMQSIVNVNIVL